MAEVTGSITGSDGTKDIHLNNAATEATLKLLLQSNLAANKQSIDNIKSLAQKSGLDPAAIAAANTNIQKVSTFGSKLGTGFEALGFAAGYASKAFTAAAALTEKLASGGAQASDVFAAFNKMPLGIGLVASGFQKLATIQEAYLKTYQELGSAGINFGGSLTDMRMAASQSYLTLDQFSKTVKENASVFSTLGGNAQDGVNQFVKIQNTLLAPGSATSKNLAYLGISAQEAADLTASYMRSQGTMNKSGLQDTKATSAAVAEYAQELSTLSALTGKSTLELRKKMDEENSEAQWSAALAAMSPEKAAKLQQGLLAAQAQGGKPAMDAFKAIALGLPPMTEGAKLYTATQQAGVNALQKYSDRANNAGISTEQNAKLNRITLAKQISEGAMDREKLRTVLQADALAGGKLSASFADATKFQTQFMKDGKMLSEQEILAKMDAMAADKKRTDGDAVAAQQAQLALNKLGQEVLDKLLPLFKILQPIMLGIINGFTEFATYLLQSPKLLGALGVAAIALTGAFVAYQVVVAAARAKELVDMARRMKEGGLSAALSKPGANPKNPLYVYVVNQHGGGFEMPGSPEGKGGKGGKVGIGKRILGGLKGGVPGIVGGLALDYASEKLEESGHEKLGAGANIASSALSMAGTGAMIGSVVPGLGTAVGGAVGGVLGAGYGAYQNWGKLTGPSKETLKPPVVEPALIAAKAAEEVEITKSEELLRAELKTLNKTTTDLLRYMMETAEYTRRNYNATRSLDGNMFARP